MSRKLASSGFNPLCFVIVTSPTGKSSRFHVLHGVTLHLMVTLHCYLLIFSSLHLNVSSEGQGPCLVLLCTSSRRALTQSWHSMTISWIYKWVNYILSILHESRAPWKGPLTARKGIASAFTFLPTSRAKKLTFIWTNTLTLWDPASVPHSLTPTWNPSYHGLHPSVPLSQGSLCSRSCYNAQQVLMPVYLPSSK